MPPFHKTIVESSQRMLADIQWVSFTLQVEDVGHSILGCLLSEWGLASELLALRNLYLLAAPAAQVR
jgi:hypothetical protein